ncbi:MAG: putative enoyl-CoA hydratase echA8 [Syntrophorhabdaceae bacterium PtaU1.Bin034]|nr:MAG: putative enoyl-CoA hydratase echA8 [Syntrophorhabdaceae bacterium PtaU1.Bin034]
MAEATILHELKNSIGYVTINRPKFLNAVNKEILAELHDILSMWKEDDTCRGIIITGAGEKTFSPGADINVFIAESQKAIGGREWSRYGQVVLQYLENLGKPSIAAINGMAMGGGLELTLACTFRIACETAKFGLPEIGVGIMPGWGGTQRMTRLVGKTKTMELVLTGEPISAEEALRTGLVSQVVPVDDLIPAAERFLKRIIKNAPVAIKLAMEAINSAADLSLSEGLGLESNLAGLLCMTEDGKEGIQAFTEKRKPVFKGR